MFRTTGCRVPASILRSNASLKLPVGTQFTTKTGASLAARASSSRLHTNSTPPIQVGLLNGNIRKPLTTSVSAVLAPRVFSTFSHQLEEIKKSRDAPISGDKATADVTSSSTTPADLSSGSSDVVDPAKAIASDIVRGAASLSKVPTANRYR
jgi:hypothetical protein